MNAGAYGGQMSDVVISAECISRDGGTVCVGLSDMGSDTAQACSGDQRYDDNPPELNVLKKRDKAEIEEKMKELTQHGAKNSRLNIRAQAVRLSGPRVTLPALNRKMRTQRRSVGGAAVSEKHAGFIINTGSATCGDVTALIKQVQQTVLNGDGVLLEPEVIQIGRSDS